MTAMATNDAYLQKIKASSVKLCPELKAFYDDHGISGEELLGVPLATRFVRLNPHGDIVPIPWLDDCFGFHAIPGDFSLAQSKAFRSGRIYGMDVSSGAAVAALLSGHEIKHNVRVLDLCCSPGLKLCMIADLLSCSSTVVGVDISKERLAVCKRVVKKYHVDRETSGHTPACDDTSKTILCRWHQFWIGARL